MELSPDVLSPFLVWGLQSGNETVIGNGCLHLLDSSGTLITCFLFCRLEEMKSSSLILPAQAWHTWSGDMSDLSISRPITNFWNPLRFNRGLKIFCMEMFKFSKSQQSLQLLFTLLLIPHHHPPNTTSDYFILIHSTVSQWLFTLWLAVLIQFTKPVTGLSKYLTGAAIKNAGHPGRQFLTASSLCALAFKLLKPPNYTGYHLLVICGDTGMSIVIIFAWKFSTIVQF